MCGKNQKVEAIQFDENSKGILPKCANSTKCGGACKQAQKMLALVEANVTDLRPIIVIDGQAHVPELVYNPK